MIGIDLNGFAPSQGLTWAAIELISNGIKLRLGKATEVSAFGEILAQKPIGVFIAAALLGAVLKV